MNVELWLEQAWKRDVIRLILEGLAKRDYSEMYYDRFDDDEMFERILLLLWPEDGRSSTSSTSPPSD